MLLPPPASMQYLKKGILRFVGLINVNAYGGWEDGWMRGWVLHHYNGGLCLVESSLACLWQV